MILGKRIRSLRTAAKMTQDDLARLLGVTRNRVSQIETEDDIKLSALVRLARAFHMMPSEILEGTDFANAIVQNERQPEASMPDEQSELLKMLVKSQLRIEKMLSKQTALLESKDDGEEEPSDQRGPDRPSKPGKAA